MAAKETRVDIIGSDVVLQVADQDMKKAIECLEKNGTLRFRFGEMRIREFPKDMSFEPARGSKSGGDGGDGDGGDGGDGGGDGGGYDID
jgi:hypothetical protein